MRGWYSHREIDQWRRVLVMTAFPLVLFYLPMAPFITSQMSLVYLFSDDSLMAILVLAVAVMLIVVIGVYIKRLAFDVFAKNRQWQKRYQAWLMSRAREDLKLYELAEEEALPAFTMISSVNRVVVRRLVLVGLLQVLMLSVLLWDTIYQTGVLFGLFEWLNLVLLIMSFFMNIIFLLWVMGWLRAFFTLPSLTWNEDGLAARYGRFSLSMLWKDIQFVLVSDQSVLDISDGQHTISISLNYKPGMMQLFQRNGSLIDEQAYEQAIRRLMKHISVQSESPVYAMK